MFYENQRVPRPFFDHHKGPVLILLYVDPLDKYVTSNYDAIVKMAVAITRGDRHDADDLAHEVMVILYESDRGRMVGLIERGQMRYWIARIMMNQYNSKTSPWHYKYRKQVERHRAAAYEIEGWSTPDDGEWERREALCNFVEKQLERYPYFERMVFMVYVAHGHSLNTLAKETGISRTTIYKAIKHVRDAIKQTHKAQKGQGPR